MKVYAEKRRARGGMAQKEGLFYEALAALWLRAKGYRILGQRLATPVGEVDILATRGNALVLVEVKKRSGAEAAASAISASQKQRLVAAAAALAGRYGAGKTIRIDAILFSPASLPKHIKNAF